tara:strand:+ start:49 stop:570 length:522 start_codon:yes stop_codon:yes gene_type:complete
MKITRGVLMVFALSFLFVVLWRAKVEQGPLNDAVPVDQEQIVEDYRSVPEWGYERIKVVTPTPQEIRGQRWAGTASWYSREGCIGCSANLHMANGKPLDDNALTVAFNRLPLGRKVRVTNAESMMTVVALITDTGGFERHGRIIDITPKVRDSINCGNLCEVIVEEILEEIPE